MDTAAFEQMYEAFWEFRSLFVPLFGRRESRDHRQNYLRAFRCTPKTGATPRISPSQWEYRLGHPALPHQSALGP